MKKILMLLAAIAVMAAPAFAQNAFSDVPSDHWAYDAVSQLANRGIVEGYPDGTFKGKRTLTRYEYAVIIARLMPYITEDGGINPNAFAKKSDLAGYAKLSDIKGVDLSGVASKADLDAIAKLANEFKAELTALGVDVNALNAEINALKARVAAIEDEQARVKITGNLTVAGVYTVGKHGEDVYDIDRNIAQTDSQGVKLTKDFEINVKGRVNNNINAYLTLVAGDYIKKNLDTKVAWDTNINNSVDASVMPYYMYAAADYGKWGSFKLGRMPFQINKYVYKKYDADSYVDIARMDNGDYQVDGIDYNVALGSFDVRAWLAEPVYKAYGDATLFKAGLYDTMAYGLVSPVKTMAGAQLGFNIAGARIEALANYNEAKDADGIITALGYKNSTVYGGTIAVPFGSVAIDGALFEQKTKILDENEKAKLMAANASLAWGNLTAKVGYKDVKSGYLAPADWETMAYIHNPDNIKGFNAFVGYDFGAFDVFGSYKQYKDKDEYADSKYGHGDDNDKIKYMNAGVNFALGTIGKFNVKYEDINNHGYKANYTTASWLKTIGNANFKLAYQYVNNKDKDNKGSIVYGQAGYSF